MIGEASSVGRRRIAVALVILATIGAFLPSLRNDFVTTWDDDGYVLFNPHIRELSFQTVRWAFTEFWCNYWAPLTWLSLAVDHAAWGLDPVGFHLTNVVLHALSAGLFLLVAHRLLAFAPAASGGEGDADARALPAAALAALLFALHPLRVESVAWVTERKDVLSVALGLGAVLAYLHHARAAAVRAAAPGGARGAPGRAYALSVALYALSLLAKSHLVSLGVMLLVLDAFPLRRPAREGWRRLVLEKVPYLALAVPVAVLTALAHRPQTKSLADIDLATRVVVASRSLLTYLRLTVLPLDVSPVYLHPGNLRSLAAGDVLAVLAVLALAAALALSARRAPAVAAAGAIWAISLGPVSGLLQNGPQAMAGRFTYVPSMASALLAAAGLAALHRRAGAGGRRALAAAVAVALAAYVALTVRDVGWWRDDVTLWSRAIDLNPGATGKQYFLRAIAHQARGAWGPALVDLDEAQAIAARKGYRAAHEIMVARARVFRDMGDRARAIAEYERAAAVSPGREAQAYLAERAELGP